MPRVLLGLTIGLIAALLVLPNSEDIHAAKRRLKPFRKSDTVAQSGASAVSAHNAPITGEPFAFAQVGRVRRFGTLTITLTIASGDTERRDFDRNQLSLALDGIDTGILLNDFGEERETLTFTGAPANVGQILAALKADGKLDTSIVDQTPQSNFLSVPGVPTPPWCSPASRRASVGKASGRFGPQPLTSAITTPPRLRTPRCRPRAETEALPEDS